MKKSMRVYARWHEIYVCDDCLTRKTAVQYGAPHSEVVMRPPRGWAVRARVSPRGEGYRIIGFFCDACIKEGAENYKAVEVSKI